MINSGTQQCPGKGDCPSEFFARSHAALELKNALRDSQLSRQGRPPAAALLSSSEAIEHLNGREPVRRLST